jgi:hypothetical protein
MSNTCPFCKAALDEKAIQCACGAVKQTGLVQKLAGGIAFAATLILLTAAMLIIAAIEPLAQRVYSEENMSSTTQMAIFFGFICMWVLRSEFRKPKWTPTGR